MPLNIKKEQKNGCRYKGTTPTRQQEQGRLSPSRSGSLSTTRREPPPPCQLTVRHSFHSRPTPFSESHGVSRWHWIRHRSVLLVILTHSTLLVTVVDWLSGMTGWVVGRSPVPVTRGQWLGYSRVWHSIPVSLCKAYYSRYLKPYIPLTNQ